VLLVGSTNVQGRSCAPPFSALPWLSTPVASNTGRIPALAVEARARAASRTVTDLIEIFIVMLFLNAM
jgi:hypothetical protein